MTVASVGSGTWNGSLDSEDTLDTETDPGVYVLVVDTNEMVNGDVLVLRIKTKDKSGGASRLAFQAVYAHIQAEPHKYSPPIPIDTEILCTLEQTDGTGARDYDWNLLKVA
jgi:hypothetical protein